MSEIEIEFEEQSGLVVGLKKAVVSYRTQMENEEEAKCYAVGALLNSWKMIYSLGMTTQLEEMIWNYVDGKKTPYEAMIYKTIDSSLIGKKSIIADYTNKKGKTHRAHYSHFVGNQCYLGSTSKLGEEPISFKTKLRITKDKFTIDIDRLPEVSLISELFDIIEVKQQKKKPVLVVDDEEDDLPIEIDDE
jgi:hypothetical protein